MTRIHAGCLPGCVDRITQLHAQFYARTHGFGAPFEAKVASELARFCAGFRPGVDGLWLALQPGIEGSVALDAGDDPDAGHARLRWFITSDALRGRGVGRQLLAQALAFADARGCRTVTLSTFAGLDAARHLYESAGFRLVHQAPGRTWGPEVQEQVFVRGADA